MGRPMRIYALRTYFADGVLGQWAVKLPNHTARERELLTLFTNGHPYARTAKAKSQSRDRPKHDFPRSGQAGADRLNGYRWASLCKIEQGYDLLENGIALLKRANDGKGSACGGIG